MVCDSPEIQVGTNGALIVLNINAGDNHVQLVLQAESARGVANGLLAAADSAESTEGEMN